jgi:hypothetical protein
MGDICDPDGQRTGPWGFGGAGAAHQPWDGQYHEGFLSRHTNNHFNLSCNVTKPDGQMLDSYYLWGATTRS